MYRETHTHPHNLGYVACKKKKRLFSRPHKGGAQGDGGGRSRYARLSSRAQQAQHFVDPQKGLRRGWSRYARLPSRAQQAWHSLGPIGGAQGVVPLCAPAVQGTAGVAFSRPP